MTTRQQLGGQTMHFKRNRLVTLVLAIGLTTTASAVAGDIRVRDAWIEPAGQRNAIVQLTLVNTSDADDRLLGVTSASAARVSIQAMAVADGVWARHTLQAVDVPAGMAVPLQPGGAFLILEDLSETLRPRANVVLRLTFERAGTLESRARVRPSALADDALDNLRTDPLQQPGRPQRRDGLDDAVKTDPFLQ